MASPKLAARKAFRALRRGGFGRRMAKVGANNVGKAAAKVNRKKRGRRSYRRSRRRY